MRRSGASSQIKATLPSVWRRSMPSQATKKRCIDIPYRPLEKDIQGRNSAMTSSSTPSRTTPGSERSWSPRCGDTPRTLPTRERSLQPQASLEPADEVPDLLRAYTGRAQRPLDLPQTSLPHLVQLFLGPSQDRSDRGHAEPLEKAQPEEEPFLGWERFEERSEELAKPVRRAGQLPSFH